MAGRAFVAVALLLLTAPSAAARPDVEIGMEDERILLKAPAIAPQAVAAWRDLGGALSVTRRPGPAKPRLVAGR